MAEYAVRGCRGNKGLIAPMFFCLALVIASIGAGNIAAAALVAPMAMAVAGQAGIPAFLMVIMVAHGAVAGALSPFAPTGIIAGTLMSRMGLQGLEWQTYFNNLLANAGVAAVGYFIFGGYRLFGDSLAAKVVIESKAGVAERGTLQRNVLNPQFPALGVIETPKLMSQKHWVTLAVIILLIIGVIFFKVHVGMGAFAGAVFLTWFQHGDEREVIRTMPWGVILMVCGVTVLTSLLEKTGGLELFTDILVRFSNQESVTGVIALVTGIISVYSSTSGVVLPAFLPSVPTLVEKLGGGDPAAIASSITIGGHLVDVSPLSTIGALCVAGAVVTEDRRLLFNQVLAWGFAMSVVGAIICYVCFGLF